jgi:ribonuclease R
MNTNDNQARSILQNIAKRAMLERGLLPDFSAEALAELDKIQAPATADDVNVRDLRDLLWASIDNDDSRDLDQLTVAVAMHSDKINSDGVKILVAVADVDSIVKKGSAIDEQARHNTTSVYTAAKIFPMLPEKLSTNLTSLNLNEDRLAIVIEMVIGADGSLKDSDVYRALVRNHAQLAYNSVAAWLEGNADMPPAVEAVNGLAENLRLQDRAAQSIQDFRHLRGALCLETIEARPIFEGESILDLQVEEKNRAKEIIEDFMISANGVTIRYLSSRKVPSIRRVVRIPKRWERIVEIAAEHAFKLPKNPDSKALETFLMMEKAADPLRFPDLSLAVIKLLGSGEYVAELPEENPTGHFGLAVKDYTHSTAPNRRYPDLITQRLLKAAIKAMPVPYSKDELDDLATHCTEKEDAATKVERQVGKSAAALLLESRIGEQFDAIVTGASMKGTWVRLLSIPVEGMLKSGYQGVDVGDRIRVQLLSVDVVKGFIDFGRVGPLRH